MKIRRLPLSLRLAIAIAVSLALVGFVLVVLILQNQRMFVERTVIQKHAQVYATIADVLRENIVMGNWALADSMLSRRFSEDSDILYMTVDDALAQRHIDLFPDRSAAANSTSSPSGEGAGQEKPARVAANNSARQSIVIPAAILGANKQVVQVEDRLSIIGLLGFVNSDSLHFELPIVHDGNLIGHFRIGISPASVYHEIRLGWKIAIALIGLAGFLVIACVIIVANRVSRPLSAFAGLLNSGKHDVRTLEEVLAKTSSSELEHFLHSPTKEISDLAASFTELRSRLMAAAAEKQDLERREREIVMIRAIAQTTQMLAHDVRKPFSLVRATLHILNAATSVDQVKKTIVRAREQLDRSLAQVDSMLSDIIDVGVDSNINRQDTRVVDFIKQCYLDTLAVYNPPSVTARLHTKHRHLASIDSARVQRVIANIFGNAMQAMRGDGVITVRTDDVLSESTTMVEISIHNSGPAISSEHLPRIFDPFFTHGKRGGTGLGLAVAKKIIEDHGGRIHCESQPGKGVSFVIRVPVGAIDESARPGTIDLESLPLAQQQAQPGSRVESEKYIHKLREAVINLHKSQLSILVVDDEPTHAEAFATILRESVPDLASRLHFTYLKCPEKARELLSYQDFDILLCDIDLGDVALCGFDVIQHARTTRPHALRIIYSSDGSSRTLRDAVEAGAHAFYVKPLDSLHCCRIVIEGVERTKRHMRIRLRSEQEKQRIGTRQLRGSDDFQGVSRSF